MATTSAAAARRTTELLYDSAAALRLLDSQLDELRGRDEIADAAAAEAPPADPAPAEDGRSGLAALALIVERANREIVGVLESLRESRTALQRATVENLQHTHEKLREVTSATEVATTDILDALDRARGLVDELDEADAASERADAASARVRAAETRGKLREEIFGIMGALQFQDITTQQLNYASRVLVEMERRLTDITQIFDVREPAATSESAVPAPANRDVFDPNATMSDARCRQALADEIFRPHGAAAGCK